MRVIVVGAGVAGLTAADAARHAGADVRSSKRAIGSEEEPGPRHWASARSTSVRLGHGPVGNPLAEALADAGIDTRNDGLFGWGMAVWADGWVDAPEATSPHQRSRRGLGSRRCARRGRGQRQLCGRGGVVHGRPGARWQGGQSGPLRAHMGGGRRVHLGPARADLLAVPPRFAEGGGGNLIPVGGYRVLIERLASGLDIRRGTPATVIEHGGPGVAVRSDDGIYKADRVVVTVPLGVLQGGDLVFDPPLEGSHALAVERLAMGTLEKVVFRFEERFWPESVHWITHVADDHAFPQWVDLSRHTGSPTIAAIYNATLTSRIAETPVEQRAGLALEVLRKMFGSVPDPEETLVTDWTADPWSLGSYSYIPIGAGPEDMSVLAEPVSERLVLAGEATVPESYGTVHAAFGSGLRAAAHVLGERPERICSAQFPIPGPTRSRRAVTRAGGDLITRGAVVPAVEPTDASCSSKEFTTGDSRDAWAPLNGSASAGPQPTTLRARSRRSR